MKKRSTFENRTGVDEEDYDKVKILSSTETLSDHRNTKLRLRSLVGVLFFKTLCRMS